MKRRSFLRKLTFSLLATTFPSLSWGGKKVKKEQSMNMVLHKNKSRGVADHGWLKSHHTFSFASYYNPDRMGFGTLRVINDDVVEPSMGFGTHPHNNMEIISIPLKGSLKHKDTMGNEHVIAKGEVQAMSAGTGLQHSEYNNSSKESVNFLQIWVKPKKQNIKPNYSQKKFDEKDRLDQFQLVVSPDGQKGSVEINQDAFFSLVSTNPNKELVYSKYSKDNGVYFFVLDGEVDVGSEPLFKRDGLGIVNKDEIKILAKTYSELLIMEVPLEV